MLWYIFQCCMTLGRLKRLKNLFIYSKEISLGNCVLCDKNDKVKSIATWNLQGLFIFMNPKKKQNIIDELYLMDQDVLCLQEVFEISLKKYIINELKYKYPYYLLGNIHKKYIIGDDSGLLVLSKYKIEFVKEYILPEAVFPDKLANKSILYFRVGNLNLVTTHLQSSYMKDVEYLAANEIKLLMKQSPFNQYIITGDLNNPDSHIHINKTKNNYHTTWNNKILDYIIPINYDNIKLKTNVSRRSIKNITDHNCLMSEINYL